MPHAGTTHAWLSSALAGMLITLGVLGALMLGLKAYCVRCAPHAELPRKLLHIGMGLVTLTFPWLFDRPWPVLVLAGIAVALLVAVKLPGPLHTLLGGVADGVERHTYGDLYFPLGVAALFWLAHGDRILFCIPMLLLTLGDAVAALVGVRYGRLHFTTGEGNKSAEGSLACFVVALLCTLVPLLLFTQTGRSQTLLIALIVALLATLLEAVAWRGLDNLFLPLGGFLLLKTHLQMSPPTLVTHLVVTVGLFLFVVAWRHRTALNDSAVLGAALYGYCVWSIGGLPWLFAPIFLFVAYPLIWPRTGRDAGRSHRISVVLFVGAAGLLWLFIAIAFRLPDVLYLYNVAFGAQMAMIGLARLRHRYQRISGAILLPLSVIGSWLLLVAPALFAETARSSLPARCLAAFCGLTLAAVLFDRLRRDLRDYPCDSARWQLQAALGALGSLVGLLPLLWGR